MAALLSFLPIVAGAPTESLTGSVECRTLRSSGLVDIVSSSPTVAYLGWDPAQREETPGVAWALEAERVVVNWTRLRQTGVGTAPGNPDEPFMTNGEDWSYGEETLTGALTHGTLDGLYANLLLNLQTEGTSHIQGPAANLRPATAGERWVGGYLTGVGVPPATPDQLSRMYDPPAGQPTASVGPSADLRWNGSFTIDIWGGQALAEAPTTADGRSFTLRSGTWSENGTARELDPNGVTRDVYHQLLELRVTNGTLRVSQTRGAMWATTRDLTLTTAGTTRITEATGHLDSRAYYYDPKNSTFDLEGNASFHVAKGTVASGYLEARVAAERATLSLPASGLLPVPAPPPAAPTQEPPQPDLVLPPAHPFPLGATLGLIAGTALIAGVTFALPRSAMARRWRLQAAERALDGHAGALVRRRVAPLVARDPRDWEAWLLHAASHSQDDNHDALVHELRFAPVDVQHQSTIAMLVALAHMHLGDAAESQRWRAIAERDPQVANALQTHLAQQPGPTPMRTSLPDVAYA